MTPRPAFLLATLGILLAATHAIGAPLCAPQLAVKDIMFSQMHRSQRIWTARIAVDASRCAAPYGRFNIDFVRLKETGPDVRFTEQYTWTPGVIEVSTDFAIDEAVLTYAISADACPCR